MDAIRSKNRAARKAGLAAAAELRSKGNFSARSMPHNFEPPSTRMVSPVIQRASLEARKAMTPPMSSGWAMRFNA